MNKARIIFVISAHQKFKKPWSSLNQWIFVQQAFSRQLSGCVKCNFPNLYLLASLPDVKVNVKVLVNIQEAYHWNEI